jgi:hypothetical protein
MVEGATGARGDWIEPRKGGFSQSTLFGFYVLTPFNHSKDGFSQ